MEGEGEAMDKLPTLNIEQLTTKWDKFAAAYSHQDSCMQTFYYTLVHMLDLPQAKHILEVACGTGKLLPLAVQLKGEATTYLATDLSQNMVDLAKQGISQFLDKMGVSQSVDSWLDRQHLTLKAANGEEPMECAHKFDRIIANLVLIHTEDPVKMMKNFHSMGEEGCLLGVTVWGDQKYGNMLSIMLEAMKASNTPVPSGRAGDCLYNKLSWLAKESGW